MLFVPDSYFLRYAVNGSAAEAGEAVIGYATALERLCLPYEVVEANHLEVLDRLDVLFMPWALVVPAKTREAILRFLARGGTLLTEAETDAFDGLGFYRYPNERPLMQALGLQDLGRRKMAAGTALSVQLDGQAVAVPADNFLTPLATAGDAEVLAAGEQGEPLLVRRAVGQGTAYVAGTFLGRAYRQARSEGFERLLEHVCLGAGVQRDFEIADSEGDGSGLQWRTGLTGASRLLWIINSGGERTVTIVDAAGRFGEAPEALDLAGGKCVPIYREAGQVSCEVALPAGGFVVLRW